MNNWTFPSILKVHLKRSKCDQFGRGFDIIVGWTDTSTCPVAAVSTYIGLWQDRAAPFFITAQGSPGLPQDEYAEHSFHFSAATSAALAGMEDCTIQTLGRWQSSTFLQYICMPREQLVAISRRLALAVAVPPTPLEGHTLGQSS